MFYVITQSMIKQTIEYPDKVSKNNLPPNNLPSPKKDNTRCYIKKFSGRELLVMAEKFDNGTCNVKYCGWLNELAKPLLKF